MKASSAPMARSTIMAAPILASATVNATADRPSSRSGSAKTLRTTPSNIARPNSMKTKRLVPASSWRYPPNPGERGLVSTAFACASAQHFPKSWVHSTQTTHPSTCAASPAHRCAVRARGVGRILVSTVAVSTKLLTIRQSCGFLHTHLAVPAYFFDLGEGEKPSGARRLRRHDDAGTGSIAQVGCAGAKRVLASPRCSLYVLMLLRRIDPRK